MIQTKQNMDNNNENNNKFSCVLLWHVNNKWENIFEVILANK